MKNSYKYLLLFIGIGLLFASTSFVKGVSNPESCSTSNEDGKCVGSEASDGDESQNFCTIEQMGLTKKISINKDDLQQLLNDHGYDMNSLDMEIVISFLDSNKDRIITLEEFLKIWNKRPDMIVHTMYSSFRYLDADHFDGIITFEDLQEALENSVDTEELALISSDLDNLPEGQLTILEFIKPLIRLANDISTALTPFLSLDHLPPCKAISAVARNLRNFKEADVDNNGILSKDEFLCFGLGVDSEDNQNIFAFIDKNKDDEIHYTEFQVVLPRIPKYRKEDFKNIFKLIDTNEDGFATEKELRIYLANLEQNKFLNIPIPNDNKIDQTYSKLDVDKDEKLSFEEMKPLIEELKVLQINTYEESFLELDADWDGKLSKENMIAVAKQIEKRTNQPIDPDVLTTMIDKDADGMVSFEEWLDYVFQQPQQP